MSSLLPKSDPRSERLLREYAILEGDSDETYVRAELQDRFADVVKLARILCDAPVSFISFIGDETQWLSAREGVDLASTPRSDSFCAFAMTGHALMVVPDARLDPRFAANPFVTGEPWIRFYAGAPLRSPGGVALGTLCVLDVEPRDGLTENQMFGLTTLAAQVMAQLESQRRAAWRTQVQTALLNQTADSGSVQIVVWNIASDRRAVLQSAEDAPAVRDRPAIEAFLATVHRDDRGDVATALAAVFASGNDLTIEFRTDAGNKDRRMLLRGRIVGETNGNRRFAGVLTDLTRQRAAERTSAEHENRFRILADAMPQMVWSTTPDGSHDYFNARWYEFTGVPDGSTDGDGWNDLFHPDDRELAWERWRHSLSTGDPYEIEYRLRHRSGHYRWTLGRALPMRNERGDIVRWFGTCTDIDDAKRIAAERELVAQELSHRIKNTFLVISGLIGLYARNDPAIRPFASEMRERIAALGRAHNFVRPHSLSSRPVAMPVTLHRLLDEIFAPYRLDGKSRISIEGTDLAIDDRAATPLALLLHELSTNAVKYGALSVESGVVALRTWVDGDRLSMEWVERGGPAVDADRIDGFGTRVANLSVESQLGGTLSRHWERNGLRVEITIPKASLDREGETPSVFSRSETAAADG